VEAVSPVQDGIRDEPSRLLAGWQDATLTAVQPWVYFILRIAGCLPLLPPKETNHHDIEQGDEKDRQEGGRHHPAQDPGADGGLGPGTGPGGQGQGKDPEPEGQGGHDDGP
jgi:hypothetical protein